MAPNRIQRPSDPGTAKSQPRPTSAPRGFAPASPSITFSRRSGTRSARAAPTPTAGPARSSLLDATTATLKAEYRELDAASRRPIEQVGQIRGESDGGAVAQDGDHSPAGGGNRCCHQDSCSTTGQHLQTHPR